MPLFYPSILFQERVLGFVMGGLVGAGVSMYDQREIWKSTAGLAEMLSRGTLPAARGISSPPPILGREARADLAHLWNSAVDRTFGPLIAVISSKGW
ncbi:uncharacterized protein [Physcomitrium patens]|uniref:Uncharacterized protein n=1 Tax=Physcomitrium patens TaxID=3218 RepID=A0A2K1KAU3_PHYPA|nr:uncharacterized protein LOC112284399 [Physcomitrium patens]PNR50897.1 hypothetical protein PHYPA_010083 [Physcomitrium patens]|eukprot:XP_024379918.1 uncharacterized protein LOC112284399 [Physcomitrella patens]